MHYMHNLKFLEFFFSFKYIYISKVTFLQELENFFYTYNCIMLQLFWVHSFLKTDL